MFNVKLIKRKKLAYHKLGLPIRHIFQFYERLNNQNLDQNKSSRKNSYSNDSQSS